MSRSITVVIPTYNAGKNFIELVSILKSQSVNISEVIIIDSSSDDDTVAIARQAGFTTKVIDRKNFGHGRTRQLALECVNTDCVCFMTQDIMLCDEYSVENLVNYLYSLEDIAAVYGRQLPYPEHDLFAKFARIYSYGDTSFINEFADRTKKGIGAVFLSNSFSAYKVSSLKEIGGFPMDVNFGEDMYVSAKLLLNRKKTGYCAEAKVYHSHNYTLKQIYDRYKAVGNFHREQNWILQNFGIPEKKGVDFVLSEFRYLLKKGKWYLLPVALLQNLIKYIGYNVGFRCAR